MTETVVDHGIAKVRLAKIMERLAPLAVLGDPEGIIVTDVAFDSRRVVPGSLFCCLVGEHSDGHAFAGAARAAGAVAYICEHSLPRNLAVGGVQLVFAPGGARQAMAYAAAEFFGNPATKLRTIGVTGTNGKTTTTYLLRSILEQAGMRAGVIGTLDGARTTPESPDLQRALARQRDAGCVASAIEVTSHALALHRVDGMVFDVAVFTNLTQDHLDYHKTMEAYFAAKSTLFTPERARLAIVNGDDVYGRRLIDHPSIPTVSFSLDNAKDLEIGVTSSHFRLGRHVVHLPIGGEFNVRNAIGAAAAAHALGVDKAAIVQGLESASSVPGRFESITSTDGTVAIVDYAHTPAGLQEVLNAARRAQLGRVGTDGKQGRPQGRLVVVFGCGGDRDRGKRPAMGAIAAQLADLVILTSDNSRSESVDQIIAEIRAGIGNGTECVIEPDRRVAIGHALDAAQRANDVIVIAGKGHETTQQFGDRTVHFDDREVVHEELVRRGRALPTGRDHSRGSRL